MWDDPTTEADSMIYIGGCADHKSVQGGTIDAEWGPSLFRMKRNMADTANSELHIVKIGN